LFDSTLKDGADDGTLIREVLINYRTLGLALLSLVASRPGYTAIPTDFSLLSDGSSIVWSVTPLNKGDVVEVHAFKAEPGTVVVLAICSDKCENSHVVKSISIYRPPANNATERYTLEESGHLAFWTTRPPRLELNAGGSKAISDDSKNQVADVIHSGYSGLYTDANVMKIHKSEIDTDHVKVRFDGGCYVTLSRISTAAP
jgi:hypothetical protein